MNQRSSMLLSGAMELPASEREKLAISLWDSLELEDGLPEISDEETVAEMDRRKTQIQEGNATFITLNELKRQLGR